MHHHSTNLYITTITTTTTKLILCLILKAVKAMLKKIDDENKALKEVVHKCEKCSKYMHIDSDEYNDAISDEDGELWWCQTCFDYHQEHGW